ncbi:NADH dehydrogenase [ubiquinone] 1 beta subcomplex subunit 10 [Halotydeus destructor]|nr:NADH dehydrogenase [ubiquinone] 1 beta subcomplex subunit 10 [Halotydeus destructor]
MGQEESPKVDPEVYREGLLGRPISQEANSVTMQVTKKWTSVFDGPVTWFRERIVEPNRKPQPYYHQKYRRVPTIDECYTDDVACMFEADQQFKRDRKVDSAIVTILRHRLSECVFYHGFDQSHKCKTLEDEYNDTVENWFIQYGDLSMYTSCVDAYMKQKHRMVWERRQAALKEKEAQSA